MSNLRSFLLVAACVLACACGDDDPKPRPRYGAPEAISGNTQVSMLDETQKRELCQSFDVYTSTHVDLSSVAYLACLPVAIWTTLDEAGCRASLDACVKGFPAPIAVSVTAHTENVCFDSLEQCDATVAQLEGCANVNVDAALQVISGWTCARVTDPALKAMAAPMADLVNVCADVNSACNRFAAVGPD